METELLLIEEGEQKGVLKKIERRGKKVGSVGLKVELWQENIESYDAEEESRHTVCPGPGGKVARLRA